ncbi:MAG: PA14 domain-containing protein, partial [Planctomycetota bacterium]
MTGRAMCLLAVAALVAGCATKTGGPADRRKPPASSAARAPEAPADDATAAKAAASKEKPPAAAAPKAKAPGGTVLQLVWTGIDGNSVSKLTEHEKFGKSPDQARLLPAFDFENIGNGYGSLTAALLSPPETGEYTFWLASDDGGELWLGTGPDEKSCRRIAHVSPYCAPRAWTTSPRQQSGPIALEKGKRYYVKALQKEGGGGDHMSVAWRGPGIAQREVLGGRHVSRVKLDPAL